MKLLEFQELKLIFIQKCDLSKFPKNQTEIVFN